MLRRCPKPLRDPSAFYRQPGEPSCVVLDVPASFWDAVEVGQGIESGALSASSITAKAWTRGQIAWSAISDARRAEAEADKRRSEARKKLEATS